MLYLIGSVLFFSLNNVLWSHYAPRVYPFKLIGKRAFFTSMFMGCILIYVGLTQELRFQNHLLEILAVSTVGFVGLLFLVLGFKKGTVLQFSVYSLLLTFILGFVGEQTNTVSVVQKLPELLIVTLGYLAFVRGQFSKVKSKPSVLGHIYFILAHICFGGLLFLQWHLLDSVSNTAIAFFQELLVFVLASCIWMFMPVQHKEQKRIVWWQYALFALPISLAVLLGLEGLKSTHPFHSALIGLLTPMITVIIATILGIEKLKWKPMVGFMLIIFGLLMFYF